MRHAVERVLASAMRRARCAPLPVLAAFATASLLPSGALPPLLAEPPIRPSSQPAPAVVAAPPATHVDVLTVLDRASRDEVRSTVVPRPKRPAAPSHRWVRPSGGPLTSSFGHRWGRMHKGIDLGASYGAPIYAATDGVITYAGPEGGYGRLIIIRDWDGTETAYGHMSSFVRTSGRVRAGEVIARVGSAGDATGPHLHFEVRIHGVQVDPQAFLRKRDVYV